MEQNIVKESIANESELNKQRYESEFGYIDYAYKPGLLLFMGSYIYKEFRGQGKYKQMVRELLSKYPEGTTVQVPVENKVLRSMFERMGFKQVKRIEYWGELGNAILMQGIITKEAIEAL